MLARKYDNYAWQPQREAESWQQERERELARRRSQARQHKRMVLRRQFLAIIAVVFAAYMLVVWRSEARFTYSNQLVSLQAQETKLLRENDELRIEVEQLKGPDRVIGLAESQLGMKVARSNIYVKNTATAAAAAR